MSSDYQQRRTHDDKVAKFSTTQARNDLLNTPLVLSDKEFLLSNYTRQGTLVDRLTGQEVRELLKRLDDEARRANNLVALISSAKRNVRTQLLPPSVSGDPFEEED